MSLLNKKLTLSVNKLLYVLFICTLFFGVLSYNYIGLKGFSYIDEILMGVMLLLLLYSIYKKKWNSDIREASLFLSITLFYLVFSLIWGVNVKASVLTDYIIFIKPFIGFYSILCANFVFKAKQKQKLANYCCICSMIILPFALAGQTVMISFFSHSAFVAMDVSCLAMLYLVTSSQRYKDIIIALMILSIGLLTLRSKCYGFFAITALLLLFKNQIKWNYKSIIILIIGTIITLYVAWGKITYYFLTPLQNEGIETTAARLALFINAFNVLKDFIPFGPGFGSYASYASASFYSPLYSYYNMIFIQGLEEGGSFICDTFLPQLSQFGIIGVGLYILFWWKIWKRIIQNFDTTHNNINFKIGILVIFFFIIESFAASTFVQTQGMVMMMILALSLKNSTSINQATYYANSHC
jgi:hypothetical protein